MKNVTKKTLAVVGAAALALSAASCSSSDGKGDAAKSGSGKGIVSTFGSEPQNPLVPQNTNESGGTWIINRIFAGLVYYDAKGAVHNEMAESITPSNDNQTYTVKIKDGMKFSDGTPVNSDSFINAWKYAVENESLLTYFFEPIKGYEDKSMSGLKKIDDTTFEINLSQPESDFPLRLGYSAFYPLPEVAFKDMAAFGQNPVGNGIYKLSEWNHNESATVVPNEAYTGTREVKNGGVMFKFYPGLEAAYTDLLGGNLDVLNAIPAQARASYKEDLGDRAVSQPAALFYSFAVPETAPHFAGQEGMLRRQAISRAINRQELVDKIFDGSREPAKDFTSPVVDGYNPDIPGNEVLTFNPDEAKKLWAEADAISPWDGEFTIAYNADGGHQEWVDAVTNQIKNTLGINAHGNPYPDFKSLRDDITKRQLQGGFRTGWQADYPALSNFLGPIYGTGAGSNDVDYSNAEFDAMLKKGAAAPTADEANKIYNDSQKILFRDLPAIPLYYGALSGGYSENVSNVTFGWDADPIYNEIVKN